MWFMWFMWSCKDIDIDIMILMNIVSYDLILLLMLRWLKPWSIRSSTFRHQLATRSELGMRAVSSEIDSSQLATLQARWKGPRHVLRRSAMWRKAQGTVKQKFRRKTIYKQIKTLCNLKSHRCTGGPVVWLTLIMTHYCNSEAWLCIGPFLSILPKLCTQGKTAPWNPFECRIWIPSTDPNGTRLVQTAREAGAGRRVGSEIRATLHWNSKWFQKFWEYFFLTTFRCFQDFIIIMMATAHSHFIYFPVKTRDQWNRRDWPNHYQPNTWLEKGFIWFDKVLWNAVLLWESWKAPWQNSWRSTISD